MSESGTTAVVAGTLVQTGQNKDAEREIFNQPGSWNFFISYTQRNATSKSLAGDLYSALVSRGFRVWLDRKMLCQDSPAMLEGVMNSQVIICIADEDYFTRPACIQEMIWARDAAKAVVPCVVPTKRCRRWLWSQRWKPGLAHTRR